MSLSLGNRGSAALKSSPETFFCLVLPHLRPGWMDGREGEGPSVYVNCCMIDYIHIHGINPGWIPDSEQGHGANMLIGKYY